MTKAKNKHESIFAVLFCLLLSAAALAICSRSSPLYPINDWVDSNCFFTVGKAMFSGKILYLDIYEQKGIFLYFLHGLAYLLSPTSFLGVYVIETISFAAFLYIAYRIARLYAGRLPSAAMLPPLAFMILCSQTFCQGDSAEQLMLPLLLYPVFCFLRSVREDRGGIPKNYEIALIGAFFSAVLLTKFTLVGVFFGNVIVIAVLCAVKKDFSSLLRSALIFIGGACAAAAPFVLYFLINGALSAFFEVYFYNNLFLYSIFTEEASALGNLFYSIAVNPIPFAAIAIGLALFTVFGKKKEYHIGLPILTFFSFFFIYVGGRFYEYYALGVLFLSALGAAALAPVLEHLLKKLKFYKDSAPIRAASTALVSVVCLALCFFLSSNTFLIGTPKEETWQYEFAKIIESSDEKTLLNYGALDLGLYTATGIVPDEKYFCLLNIQLDEMNQAMDDAVRNKRPKFVVCRGGASSSSLPSLVTQNYKIVSRFRSHLEFEGSSATYYLLERK